MDKPTPPASPFARANLPPFVPPFLAVPSRPLVAIIGGYALAIVGSLLLSAIVQLLVPQGDPPDFTNLAEMGPGMTMFMLVIFAPVVETLIMGVILLVLQLFLRPGYAVLASAIIWGVFHSLQAPIWGLVIWWPFLIFSTLFVVWRERSMWLAFLMPAIVHAMQNTLPALLVAFPDALPTG
ncbi:CPBP family intramembrane glutamic endopeptidase [Sphingomicrobium sediminis]|uniref:CPBP family intramembrane metalloprotease n=1 Tax=Sphingomicrobium sediminis TaxID=2950949 RepID=A0A9X2J2W7_9SPHN|nr:CPBP family intramembrane glutamic endopeptidase [Sphingomicrobium sediminis]MCM8556706.1 CPBP family intramembrane metalloprotease [Sphingomicrobium sediminis]